MLRPIDNRCLDQVLPLLTRGFRNAPLSMWAGGIARLKQYRTDKPVAYLLESAGQDVGVLLTIPSARLHEPGPARNVINLSSWYIDKAHRWRAPRMLQQITADDATLYTDLTPTAVVRNMIERFGFIRQTEGALLFAVPWFAWRKTGEAHVIPLDRLPPDSLPASMLHVMVEHAGWDCLAAALWDGARLHPLIFSRTYRNGLPVARLVYAKDKTAVTRHIAAISRYLLREKLMLLAMNADSTERFPGSIFTRRAPATYFKGAMNPASVDHTYSEFVFLRI